MHIQKITIERGKMICEVRLSADAPKHTNEAIAAEALLEFPTLGEHTCINKCGPTFSAVIANTSIPHLLEHLIIQAQVQDACTSADSTFVGATKWLDKTAGLAQVSVNFYDDLVALQAAKTAQSQLLNIINTCKK